MATQSYCNILLPVGTLSYTCIYSSTDDMQGEQHIEQDSDADLTIGGELLYYVQNICADRWASFNVFNLPFYSGFFLNSYTCN